MMATHDIEEPLGAVGGEPGRRTCVWPGCSETADHRAPVSRDQLNRYQWFCLEHVRIYNRSWSYYEGLSDAEIEASIRSDTIWNRPSWPLDTNAGGQWRAEFGIAFANIHDPLNLLGPDGQATQSGRPPLTSEESQALSVLGLAHPVTEEEVRARYKILVKRHHPDANGGSKIAEEKLKRINQAYETVKSGTLYSSVSGSGG